MRSVGVVGFMHSVILLLTLVSRFAAGADVPNAEPNRSLDGTWRADAAETLALELSIKDHRIEMAVLNAGNRLPGWVGRVEFSKDEPTRQMDWVELRAGETMLPDNKCLFELQGNLLLVIGGGPNQRPTRFFSGPGGEPKTLVFRRVEARAK